MFRSKKQYWRSIIAALVVIMASAIVSPVGAENTTWPVLALARAHSVPASQDQDDDGPGWTRTDEAFPLSEITFNECQVPGEQVAIVGEVEVSTKMRTDNNGITHIKQRIVINGYGTGAVTGAQYVLRDTEFSQISQRNPFPFSLVDRRTTHLKGQGVPDMTLRYYSQLVFDADGNETNNVFDFRIDCH